jgi:transcriptional regulator with XRE-family HTH domain
MITATLGGLIKDYRIKKRLSQLEISSRIGWKDSTRLSKIEQGRAGRLTRLTLDKVMDALGLNLQEKGQMLLASDIVPTPHEVHQALKKLKGETDDFDCPILIIDVAWNTFYFNNLARKLYGITDKEYSFLEKNRPNWTEMLFLRNSFNNIQMRGGYSEKRLRPYKEHIIDQFKFEQEGNANVVWYRNLLQRLNQNTEFRKLWSEIPMSKENHFYEYECNEFTGNWRGKKETLKFHMYCMHPSFDFRFYVMTHHPADKNTYEFYQKLKD